jgi:hypothetical protein
MDYRILNQNNSPVPSAISPVINPDPNSPEDECWTRDKLEALGAGRLLCGFDMGEGSGDPQPPLGFP